MRGCRAENTPKVTLRFRSTGVPIPARLVPFPPGATKTLTSSIDQWAECKEVSALGGVRSNGRGNPHNDTDSRNAVSETSFRTADYETLHMLTGRNPSILLKSFSSRAVSQNR